MLHGHLDFWKLLFQNVMLPLMELIVQLINRHHFLQGSIVINLLELRLGTKWRWLLALIGLYGKLALAHRFAQRYSHFSCRVAVKTGNVWICNSRRWLDRLEGSESTVVTTSYVYYIRLGSRPSQESKSPTEKLRRSVDKVSPPYWETREMLFHSLKRHCASSWWRSTISYPKLNKPYTTFTNFRWVSRILQWNTVKAAKKVSILGIL